MRRSSWVRVPILASALAALSSLLGAPETSAQPRGPAPKVDAGAGARSLLVDAGLAQSLDARSPTSLLVDAAAPPVLDAGAPSVGPQPPVLGSIARRQTQAPIPPPTQEQLDALAALRDAVAMYERGARDYKDTVSSIVTLHYERKKKTILGELDREIAAETVELKKARKTAIEKLEAFVAKYSGAAAHPENTPDAMFRLAALYDEVARTSDDAATATENRKKAVALYKRIIREFGFTTGEGGREEPSYREISGVFYYLGHALLELDRKPEAMQVWRSLACRNRYPYPVETDAKDPGIDKVRPMPQDNTEEYWRRWRQTYASVADIKKPSPETRFIDPYPNDCEPIAQLGLKPGEDPRYIAEVWWQMGNWEFDQEDIASGFVDWVPMTVWGLNRAERAYRQSMKVKKPPLYGVAMYKWAWTLFKQERFQSAVGAFVQLLDYTDEQQKLTGDPGADFRREAYTYIAGSLVNVDFVGPSADEPYMVRDDIVVTNPELAEEKLKVAISRVQDPTIIPQGRPWTIEVYKALAEEYRQLNHYKSAIEVYRLMLQKWPMDPSAPDTQNSVAESYELLVRATKIGEERRKYEEEVLKARTALSEYVGDKPWVDANKDNPRALQRAEELVKTGLKSAAIVHSRNGQALVDEASATGDRAEQERILLRAQSEYRLAAIGWDGYITQDPSSTDNYRSRFYRADALYQVVAIQRILHQANLKKFGPPGAEDIRKAKEAAIDVRDSDENDEYMEPAAVYVVDLSDVARDVAVARFQNSGGREGIEGRRDVRLEGPAGNPKAVVEEVPTEIVDSMRAREEFTQRIPPELDTQNRIAQFQFYIADQFFIYGHFKQARERFEPIYKDHCGKDEWGFEAWKRLVRISNIEQDTARSRELAEAEKKNSCAKTESQRGDARVIVDPTLQEAAYVDARKKFEEAQKASPPDPKLWREAAGMYEAALKAAPGRDEAPEAAMNAAYAYQQVGELNKAIEMYELFIDKYGNDATLNKLQKGDPKTKTGPDLKRYEERVKYLGMAQEKLAFTYYTFFMYDRAATAYSDIGNNTRYDDKRRQNSALFAMMLYSGLGKKDAMNRQYALLAKMKLSPEKRAELDYRRAEFDYLQLNPTATDAANAMARRQATLSLNAYYVANQRNGAAARFVLEAAYRNYKMARNAGDPMFRVRITEVLDAWKNLQKNPAEIKDDKGVVVEKIDGKSFPYNDYGAEVEYFVIDERIRREFDYETGHHQYKGSVKDVIAAYDKDAEKAEKVYRPELDRIAQQYLSPEWTPAVIARAGSLYDSLRTGLDDVAPVYFTPDQEKKLQKLEELGQYEAVMKIRADVRGAWRTAKDSRLDNADGKMVARYATAAVVARKNNVRNDAVRRGIVRLAFFTDRLGDDRMRKYVELTVDPFDRSKNLTYTNGMFLQWRSGMVSHPDADGSPAQLPVSP